MSDPKIKSAIIALPQKPGKGQDATNAPTSNGNASIFSDKNGLSKQDSANLKELSLNTENGSIFSGEKNTTIAKNDNKYHINIINNPVDLKKIDKTNKEDETLKEEIEKCIADVSGENDDTENSEALKETGKKFEVFVQGQKMIGEYVKGKNGKMSYYLMYPEGTDPKSGEMEFMTYLSGSGQSAKGETAFKNGFSSIGSILDGASLNMVIFAPVLPGKHDRWTQTKSQEKLEDLLTELKEEYNIDGKMSLAGVSLGANGVVSISKDSELSKWFSKGIAISPAPCPYLLKNKEKSEYEHLRNLMSEESEIPIKIYYGAKDDDKTISYLKPIIANKESRTVNNGEYSTEHIVIDDNMEIIKIGEEADRSKWVTHTWAAKRTFDLDENQDGKSDVLQWLYN